MKRVFGAAALLAATASNADEIADAPQTRALNAILTAEEASAELFGVRLAGFVATAELPWTECIEPDGDTVYVTDGGVSYGRLEIQTDGQACFNYGDGDNCFRVTRAPDGYVFWGPMRFVTTSVERGVNSCANDAPIS